MIARAFATAALVLPISLLAPAQTSQTLSVRGHDQQLRIYGVSTGDPVIVSSGDGGWTHLGPHIAELLSQRGFYVIGFDVRAYLTSFTAGQKALDVQQEPGDYAVLADFAQRAAGKKPILIGVSEGAGLSVLAATDPHTKAKICRRHRRRPSRHQRARLAVEGCGDLRDAQSAERTDVQHR